MLLDYSLCLQRKAGDSWIVKRIKLENGPATILKPNRIEFCDYLVEIVLVKIAVIIRKYKQSIFVARITNAEITRMPYALSFRAHNKCLDLRRFPKRTHR